MSTLTSSHNHRVLRGAILRAFFVAGAAAAGFALLSFWVDRSTALDLPTVLLLAAYAVLLLGCLAATRLRARQAERAMVLVALGAVATVGSTAMVTGFGLHTPGLVFFGVLACMCCAVGQARQGLMVTAAAMAVVAVLAAAEVAGLTVDAVAAGLSPLMPRVVLHLGTIAVGAAAGRMLERMVRAQVHEADERERRFRGLLGIAASAYWETDDQLRLHHVSQRNSAAQFVPLDLLPQRPPWELPELQFDDDALDVMRADMEARESFRDLALTWLAPGRPARHFLASGEPQRDAEGRFVGYWGVARDVTAERKAREALMATELRYEELFRRAPTPLVLHRLGIVLDANPAAATLFEFGSVSELIGADLNALHATGEGALLARERSEQVQQLAAGEALPPVDYLVSTRHGSQLLVTETAVRADTDGEPATLSIYVDRTAQDEAERAVRRSQALLSQVVSMSPDMISLTDISTGRLEMVNASFSRVTGYDAAEAEGRTAVELGLWRHPDDPQRLVQLLRQRGAVRDVDVEIVTRSGSVVPLLMSATRFERDGRGFVVINARDVSQAQRTRLEREAILNNASIGIAFTRDRNFVMVNDYFEQMFRWPPGTLVGQPGRVVWCSDADYQSLGTELGPALRRGEKVECERLAMRRDGSTFVSRLIAKAIDPERPGDNGTIWIAEDVTAQRQAEAALARARDDAEAANRAKSAFLANTSHEIRTPLNGLVGMARLARQPGIEPARLNQYLAQIAASAETLSAIISDILDLSKIEAGRLEIEAAPFDLPALLHSLQQAYEPLADSHGLAFELQLDADLPPSVRGDALRVRQILANYLQNAMKFTATGLVRLCARRLDGDWVRFEVHDTGPGIDEDTQRRLFRPFTQADESITRRFGGTGLGLSICRELAELMGGRVGMSSSPGAGSCFHAELPLPAQQALPEASEHGALDTDPLRGARVLLVEDNAVNMMIAVALLEQWGAAVTQAGDGPQALAAVAQAQAEGQPFDVVLMDVQMPGMSGYEATRLLRAQHSLLELPIVALTAAALTSERERAAEIGMNDFLTKPIDANRLRITLQRVLGARAAQ